MQKKIDPQHNSSNFPPKLFSVPYWYVLPNGLKPREFRSGVLLDSKWAGNEFWEGGTHEEGACRDLLPCEAEL